MAKQSNNDPDRLAQVQQSDLAESRVNEEFVDWLKRWGNTILLVILVIALIGIGWSWLKRQAAAERDNAWANLQGAQLPASLEEVAKESKGVDSVSTLALLNAGDQYLNSVQSGTRFDREETDEDFQLDDETRKLFLERANTLYSEAIVSVGNSYEQEFPKKLLVVSALFGQAAIAESQGDIEQGRKVLARIVEVANPQYPQLAEQATARTESIGQYASRITLPAQSELPEPPESATTLPDPTSLLRPDASTDAGETTDEPGDASNLILQGTQSDTTAPTESTESTEPAAEPTEPAAEPTEPAAEPTEPAPAPSEPATSPGNGS